MAPASPAAPGLWAAAPARRPSAERLVALVDRACAETDPERRASALRVAILTLERWRARGAAPDPSVGRALQRARGELWADYENLTLRRLGAAALPRGDSSRVADGGR